MPERKIPMRMCIGCREMKPKAMLVRVVKTPSGEIVLDATGKQNGRGAYLCNNPECLEKAEKGNALEHTFGVCVEKEIYIKLREEQKKLER